MRHDFSLLSFERYEHGRHDYAILQYPDDGELWAIQATGPEAGSRKMVVPCDRAGNIRRQYVVESLRGLWNHDEQRGVLYVLAILDKDRAGPRLARQIEKLNNQAGVLATRAQQRHNDDDGLEAIKLYREALNRALKTEVLQRQLGVIAPALLKTNGLSNDSADLGMALMDQLRKFDFYVQIDGADLVEDTMQRALLDAGLAVRAAPFPGRPGLALWGRLDVKWDEFDDHGAPNQKLAWETHRLTDYGLAEIDLFFVEYLQLPLKDGSKSYWPVVIRKILEARQSYSSLSPASCNAPIRKGTPKKIKLNAVGCIATAPR